jgi:hypothetical protein
MSEDPVFCGHCMEVQPCRLERPSLDYQRWSCTVCGSNADEEVLDISDDRPRREVRSEA